MRDRASEIEMMGSQYFQCLTTSHSVEASTMVMRCCELLNFFFIKKSVDLNRENRSRFSNLSGSIAV